MICLNTDRKQWLFESPELVWPRYAEEDHGIFLYKHQQKVFPAILNPSCVGNKVVLAVMQCMVSAEDIFQTITMVLPINLL